MAKLPSIETMDIVDPTVKIVQSSGINVGELRKTQEKTYSLTITQNVDVLSLTDALIEYFETLEEDLLACYILLAQPKHFPVLTEYFKDK